MRAGKLDQSVRIEQSVSSVDDYGAPAFTWSEIATVPAERIDASTEEFMRDYGVSDETVVIFRIRWRDDLTNTARLIHDGLVFDIKQLREIGRRKGLDVRCVSTGEQAET